MANWITEIVYVFCMSKRTQIAFFLGIGFFLFFKFCGAYVLTTFELNGALKGLEEVIKERFLRKYDKAAFISLILFWLLAIKLFLKDRRRLL